MVWRGGVTGRGTASQTHRRRGLPRDHRAPLVSLLPHAAAVSLDMAFQLMRSVYMLPNDTTTPCSLRLRHWEAGTLERWDAASSGFRL